MSPCSYLWATCSGQRARGWLSRRLGRRAKGLGRTGALRGPHTRAAPSTNGRGTTAWSSPLEKERNTCLHSTALSTLLTARPTVLVAAACALTPTPVCQQGQQGQQACSRLQRAPAPSSAPDTPAALHTPHTTHHTPHTLAGGLAQPGPVPFFPFSLSSPLPSPVSPFPLSSHRHPRCSSSSFFYPIALFVSFPVTLLHLSAISVPVTPSGTITFIRLDTNQPNALRSTEKRQPLLPIHSHSQDLDETLIFFFPFYFQLDRSSVHLSLYSLPQAWIFDLSSFNFYTFPLDLGNTDFTHPRTPSNRDTTRVLHGPPPLSRDLTFTAVQHRQKPSRD